MPDVPAGRIVRFGDVEVRLESGEIRRGGRRMVLPDQPLRILIRLLERPGEIVSRDALRSELWPEGTFVDFEHGLNSAMKRLRDALGDSADSPQYIETVPRRGYRLVAQVEAPVEAPVPPVDEGAAGASRAGVRRRRGWVVVAVLLAAAAAAAVGWRGFFGAPAREPTTVPALVAHRVLVAQVGEFTDRDLTPAARLAADSLIATMSELGTAQVLPTPVVSSSSDDALVAAAAASAGVTVEVITRALGGEESFEARILDTRTRQVLYVSPRFAGALPQPGPALAQLAQAVGGAIAIHLDHAFGGLQITSQPPGLDAYLEYRAGRELLDRDNSRAALRLQRASTLAPGFLLPRLTLVMAYDNAGNRVSRDAQLAQMVEMTDRLTRAERLIVEYMTESLARRYASALRALLEAERLAPQSWIINYGIQQEALAVNRPRVAIDAFARLPLHERYSRFNGWRLGILSKALHLVAEYDRELTETRRAQAYEPGSLLYRADEVRALAALGDVDALMRTIDESFSTPPTAGSPVVVLEAAARELRAHGRPDDALVVASRGIDWLRARPASLAASEEHRAHLVRMLYLAERWDEAIAELRTLERQRPASIEYAGYLGAIFAARSDRRDALAYDERLHRLGRPDQHGRDAYWRARIAALLGDGERAVAFLREAFRAGHFRGLPIHQSHEFDRLRDFQPFVDLVAPQL